MKRIVITEPLDLSHAQQMRLESLGEVVVYDKPPSSVEEWVDRCKGFGFVCSGKIGMTGPHPSDGRLGIFHLEPGTVVSFPRVNVAMIDQAALRTARVTLGYAPGCNRDSVAEWAIWMMLSLFRQLPKAVNTDGSSGLLKPTRSFLGAEVLLLGGRGAVGSAIAQRLEGFKVLVNVFERGMDLLKCAPTADVVVNCLSSRTENNGLLGGVFFSAMKPGSYFVTMTSPSIYDIDEMEKAIGRGHLAGAAVDVGNLAPGSVNVESYRKVRGIPGVLATPQIAHWTDLSAEIGGRMMVDNIEAAAQGRPLPYLWA